MHNPIITFSVLSKSEGIAGTFSVKSRVVDRKKYCDAVRDARKLLSSGRIETRKIHAIEN